MRKQAASIHMFSIAIFKFFEAEKMSATKGHKLHSIQEFTHINTISAELC